MIGVQPTGFEVWYVGSALLIRTRDVPEKFRCRDGTAGRCVVNSSLDEFLFRTMTLLEQTIAEHIIELNSTKTICSPKTEISICFCQELSPPLLP